MALLTVLFLFASTCAAYAQDQNCPEADGSCCYELGPCNGVTDCADAVTNLVAHLVAGTNGLLIPGSAAVCLDSRCFGFLSNSCGASPTTDCSGCDAAAVVPIGPSGTAPTPDTSTVVAPAPVTSMPAASTPNTPAVVAPASGISVPVASSPTTPTPAAPAPASAPKSSNSGGVSCIGRNQTVFTRHQGRAIMSDIKIGDKVLTHQGFQDFMGYIHEGSFQPTLIMKTDTGKVVELTEDHLIKVGRSYVHAKRVKIGDQLSSGKVLEVANGQSFVVSPLTRSGTIVVNDIVLSCYANVLSHNVANFVLIPLRVNMTKNIIKYFSTLTAIYNILPRWFRHIIAIGDSFHTF